MLQLCFLLLAGNTGTPYDYSFGFGGVGFDTGLTYSSNGCAWNFELNQQNKCVPKSREQLKRDKEILEDPYVCECWQSACSPC